MWFVIWKHVVFSANQEPAGNVEELDDDITVTQSQVNFTCPLTQVDHSSRPMSHFTLQQFMLSHWMLFFFFLFQNITILLDLELISDNNVLVWISAKHRKAP